MVPHPLRKWKALGPCLSVSRFIGRGGVPFKFKQNAGTLPRYVISGTLYVPREGCQRLQHISNQQLTDKEEEGEGILGKPPQLELEGSEITDQPMNNLQIRKTPTY